MSLFAHIQQKATWLALLLGSAGCATVLQTTLNPTGVRQAQREPNCTFELLTVPPSRSFIEAGVVSVDLGDGQPASFLDVNDFKSRIAHEVCLAGGDAAIAIPYLGRYTVATVIKYTAAPPAAGCPEPAGGH